MNIKITADSTCDLSEELLRQWNISLMPMHILMGDDTYLDSVTIHPADVFAHVDAGGQTPKSAAANPVEYSDFFISSCQPKPGCMEAIKAGLRKYGKFENIIETDIGTTIGGYSGPGTIGIVFAKKV